jgi:uncharacterized protein involved in exopolysaccharide biosynthesis
MNQDTSHPASDPSRPALFVPAASNPPDYSLDLRAALVLAWRGKWLVLAGAILLGSFAIAYAAWGQRFYRADSLVAVVEDASAGLSGSMGSGALGALASLAGVSVGAGQGKRSEYIAMLSSRTLLVEFIERERLLPVLFADRWDHTTSKWVGSAPTPDDAVSILRRKVLTVSDDKRTGLVTVRMEWTDPKLCARWANSLVALLNARTRQQAKAEATRSVEFLNRELENTRAVEVRQATFRLVEANLNRIMLANTQTDYALRVIDPAAPPADTGFFRPRPLIEVPLAVILGSFLGFLLALWRYRAVTASSSRHD